MTQEHSSVHIVFMFDELEVTNTPFVSSSTSARIIRWMLDCQDYCVVTRDAEAADPPTKLVVIATDLCARAQAIYMCCKMCVCVCER